MKIPLSKKQLNAMRQGKTVGLSADHIAGRYKAGAKMIDTEIDDSNVSKFNKSLMSGKGLRMCPAMYKNHSCCDDESMDGSALSLKSIGKKLSKGISKATGSIANSNVIGAVAKDTTKNAGSRIETIKKAVPKGVVMAATTAALAAPLSVALGPVAGPIASATIAGAATQALYGHDFEKPLTSNKKDYITGITQVGAEQGAKTAIKNSNKKTKVPSAASTNTVEGSGAAIRYGAQSTPGLYGKYLNIDSVNGSFFESGGENVIDGGSFKSSGGSFISPSGSFISPSGSFKAITGGRIGRMVKGSPEAKSWGEMMKSRRNKATSGSTGGSKSKRSGRMVKGSAEAKAWGEMMKARRKK